VICSAEIEDNPSRHRFPAISFPARGDFSVERCLGFAVAAESRRPIIGAEHERICSNVWDLGPLILTVMVFAPLTKPDSCSSRPCDGTSLTRYPFKVALALWRLAARRARLSIIVFDGGHRIGAR
jgi:hypothetical protein